jgi:hypothetical protein
MRQGPGELGETMLHEAISNDHAERNGSPAGDGKSVNEPQ